MSAPHSRLSLLVRLTLVAGSAGFGCSGGNGTQAYPDAVGTGTGGKTGSGGSAATDGGTGGTVGTPDASGNPDGPVVPGAMQLVPGPAVLVGPGGVSCSVAAAVGGVKPDQWCGVITPGAAATTVALSVFNLTKALAGTVLTCTGSDPNCFQVSALLGASLSTTTNDATHGFYGDTLIYYEAASVFAWRPGWSAGRVLVARDQPVHCQAGPNGPTAICVKASTDTTIRNLYAGRLDTQTGPALPLIEAISASVGDIRFSADSQAVLWSTAAAAGPETLKFQTIGDAATRATVATNVTGWSLTPGGLRYLWLSQPVTSTTLPTTGTLQSAPFPAGTPVSTIQAATFDYAAWGPTSLAVMANPAANGADLRAIPDIASPTTGARNLATQTAFGLQAVAPGGHVLYFDDSDPLNGLVNLLAVNADGTGACAVTALPAGEPGANFGSSSTGVEWFRDTVTATGATAEAVLTTLADCLPHSFSTSPFSFADVSAGLILQENFNSTAVTATLNFLSFATGGTPGSPVVIHGAANPTIMALFPDTPRVLYSVNSALTASGIFVSGELGGTTQPFIPDTTPISPLARSGGVSSVRSMLGTPRTFSLPSLGRSFGSRSYVPAQFPVSLPRSWTRSSSVSISGR